MDSSDWLDVAGKIALGVGGTALAYPLKKRAALLKVAVGRAAGVLAAKSGAFQSAEARRRRNDGQWIDRLESVISTVLNCGNPIVWLGVRESSRCFHYALTEDKVSRLRRDGKLA